MKVRLERMKGGMTEGRIKVGSFSKDWKGSELKIFRMGDPLTGERLGIESAGTQKSPQSVDSLAEWVYACCL